MGSKNLNLQKDWEIHQADYWDSIASDYNSLYGDFWSRLEDQETKEIIRKLITNPEPRILDLACGTGLGYFLTSQVCDKFEYEGIDISSKMLEKFRETCPEVKVFCTPMHDLYGFRSESFDIVISLYTSFSFTSHPSITLQEIRRVLKRDGSFLISSLNRISLRKFLVFDFGSYENYRTRNHLENICVPAYGYSIKEITSLLTSSGFTKIEVYTQGFFGGVIQNPNLWNFDLKLSRIFPNFCHTLNIIGQKNSI